MLEDRCKYFRERFPFLEQMEGHPGTQITTLEEIDEIEVKPLSKQVLEVRPYSIEIDGDVSLNSSYSAIAVQDISDLDTSSEYHLSRLKEQQIEELPVEFNVPTVGESLRETKLSNILYVVEIARGYNIKNSWSRGLSVVIRDVDTLL